MRLHSFIKYLESHSKFRLGLNYAAIHGYLSLSSGNQVHEFRRPVPRNPNCSFKDNLDLSRVPGNLDSTVSVVQGVKKAMVIAFRGESTILDRC